MRGASASPACARAPWSPARRETPPCSCSVCCKKALAGRGGAAECKSRGADAAAGAGGRAEQALPVDAVAFGVVQRNFEDLRLDHDLLGLEVDLLEQFADPVRESRQV